MTLDQAYGLISFLAFLLVAMGAYLWKSREKRTDEKFKEQRPTEAVIETRLRRLEQDYHLLHVWKNSIFDQEVERALRDPLRRIEKLERKVFNGKHHE